MDEIWKPVKGYEGTYSVSSYGRFRRDTTSRGGKAGTIIKGYTKSRYIKVCLTNKETKEHKHRLVHSLVLESFIGDRPKGLVINHKDGNKFNNHLSNLEYVTNRENFIHALNTGLRPRLLKNIRGKWTVFNKTMVILKTEAIAWPEEWITSDDESVLSHEENMRRRYRNEAIQACKDSYTKASSLLRSIERSGMKDKDKLFITVIAIFGTCMLAVFLTGGFK